MAKGKYRDRHHKTEEEKNLTWVLDKEDMKGRDPDEVTPAQLADAEFERQAAALAAG